MAAKNPSTSSGTHIVYHQSRVEALPYPCASKEGEMSYLPMFNAVDRGRNEERNHRHLFSMRSTIPPPIDSIDSAIIPLTRCMSTNETP